MVTLAKAFMLCLGVSHIYLLCVRAAFLSHPLRMPCRQPVCCCVIFFFCWFVSFNLIFVLLKALSCQFPYFIFLLLQCFSLIPTCFRFLCFCYYFELSSHFSCFLPFLGILYSSYLRRASSLVNRACSLFVAFV